MFNKLNLLALTMACLMLSPTASTAAIKIKLLPSLTISQAESTEWKKLIQYIAEHGKVMEADMYSYLYIENTQLGPNGKDRQSEYLSVVGFIDKDGVFNASHLEGVSEKWTLQPEQQKWNIDQWLFKLEGSGALKWAAHMDMIQTVDHHVLKHEYVDEPQSSLNKQWQKKLQEWYQFISK